MHSVHAHTHTHTHMHTRTRTHTCMHTHAHAHARTHGHAHTHTHTHAHTHTHTLTQQDFPANAARDQINQKSLSYFTQCDLGSTLWLFLGLLYGIFILVSTRLATFPRCDPSHVILFRFLSAITLGCGLTVCNFATQANTAACMLSPFLKCGRRWMWGSVRAPGHSFCRRSGRHLLPILPLPQRLLLVFIRHEVLLTVNVNTKHSGLTLRSHFSLHEK